MGCQAEVFSSLRLSVLICHLGPWWQTLMRRCMTRSVGFVPHTTKQFSHISSVSYNSTQFWHYLPRDSVKSREKAMAPYSSTLAWKTSWAEEPDGLQSMGFRRVGHDWTTSLSLFTFMHWRRKWQPTPVFLPGESQERESLVGCCLWGRTELDMTEAT